MTTPVELVLSKLADLKPNGDGEGWSARCPAHDDRAPSLSVSEGDDGRALVHCHAGCTPEAIVGALGLSMKDLMPPKPIEAARKNNKKKIVATYDYRDEENQLLFQVVRFDPKDFRQRRPVGKNRWSWPVQGVRQLPYRLPALLKHPPEKWVLVVEGEKDVNRLASLQIVATTNAGGAGKWRAGFAEFFRGRRVAILPDNDEAGRKHAQAVAESLCGIAAAVKTVELPGLPVKGDVSDWLDAGGTKEALAKLVLAAPVWKPNAAGAKAGAAQKDKEEAAPFVPFPTNVLPTVPRDLIRHGAKALGCDESYVALPLLAALASAVGNTRRIRLKATWCEPCIVWAVIVGESGTLKSPALDLVLKPLHDLQAAAFAEYREAMEQYARDKATFDADLNEWKKKGRKAGEPPPDEPEEPVAIRYVCADTTVEALAVLLERQPRGLLMARDELSGWVNSFDAYKSSRGADVGHWLSMHRAGPLTVDRKTGRRVIHVPRAAISIVGGVQPGALAAALAGRYSPREGEEGMDKPSREHFDNGLRNGRDEPRYTPAPRW